MSVMLQYIAHSAFYIKFGEYGILIDPFISGNPNAQFDIKNENITDIIVTHGHADHLGDAINISRDKKSVVTCNFELANYCMSKGAYTNAVNLGGKIKFNWGSVKLLPAFHSSSNLNGEYAGMPASVLIEIGDKKIYHAGDTCLHSEMKVVGEVYKPDIALLPIGSYFTMDIDDAVIAAQWIGAKKVIPMHYNTFPPIKVNSQDFKNKIEAIQKECLILNYGEKIEL